MSSVPFGVLRHLLLDLGFSERVEPGQYARFDDAASETWFIYPPWRDEDEVDQLHLIATERVLEGRGLLARTDFQERLRARWVAG